MCCQKSREDSVELADIFRMHGEKYCQENKLTSEQYKVIHAIENCRTSILGGHVRQCDYCGELNISYNSCRNRHCPKCQTFRTLKWLADRRKELLPVQYFHVVFTLPHELNILALYNKKLFYSLLFQSAWEALKKLGADPKRLGGLIGMLAILHTWGQNLSQHNHVHCIVPGGAIIEGQKWKSSRNNYLFPVKVLSKLFRKIYISKLEEAHKNKQIKLSNNESINDLTKILMRKDWVVYAKKPFAGSEKLLDYLGRYTHKIAISNYRILSCDRSSVTFKWRDYSDNNKEKIMKLKPEEFIRRFLTHVVPSGFMRIRFFGFLANACKSKSIAIIRRLLPYKPAASKKEKNIKAIILELTGIDILICPSCKRGNLYPVRELPLKFATTIFDTS